MIIPGNIYNDGVEGELYDNDGPSAILIRSATKLWQLKVDDNGNLTIIDVTGQIPT